MNDQSLTIRKLPSTDFEVMENNTYIHPDEKLILRSFANKMKEFIDPTDADTNDNREFKMAIQTLDRISL